MTENININVNVDSSGATEQVKSLREQLRDAQRQAEILATQPVVDEKALKEAVKYSDELSKRMSDANNRIKELSETSKTTTETLKTQFREAQRLVQELAAQPEELIDKVALQAAIARTAELRDRMNDVNEQVGVLAAGSKFEQLSNNLGDIGGKIMSLDFEGANESAERLVQLGKKISFKEAIGQIKDMGKTFFNLGKALLTNPFFLLSAVIIAIGVAIFKFKDSIKPLQKAFELIGAAIDYVIQLLKDFADWMGISDFAGEEAAQNQIKRNEDLIESEKAKSDSVIGDMEREMAILSAKGEDTTEIERKIQREKMRSAYSQIESIRSIIQAEIKLAEVDGKMTDERRQKIKDLKKDITDLKDGYKDAVTQLEVIDIKEQKNIEKNNDDKLKKQKDYQEKAKKAREQYAKDRESNARLIKDIELSLIVDQYEREIAINEEKYKRIQNDILADMSKTEAEKTKLKQLYTQEEANEEAKIKQSKIDRDNADIETEKQQLADFSAWKLSLQQNEYIVATTELDNQTAKDKETAKKALDAKLLTEEEYNQALLDLDNINNTKRKELVDLNNVSELSDLQSLLDAKLISEQDFIDKKLQLEEDATKKAKALANEEKRAKVQMASDAIGAIGDLLTSFNAGNEKDAKRQFNINKAFSIGQAAINTGLAVTGALTAGGNPIKLATGAQFVEAGIAATIGAANIAKITSTKFGGSGSSGGSSSGSSASSRTSNYQSNTSTAPQFNLFGSGSSNSNVTENNNMNDNNNTNMNVNVTISESEITSVQNKVNKIKTNAEL